MKKLDKLVLEITELSKNYTPGVAVRQQLFSKTIVPFIGPSAIGKNTLMEEVLRLNSQFGRAIGFTTRPKRDGEADDTYNFIPHTTDELTKIKRRLEDKELVQVAVFPTTGIIYGSFPEDYEHTYTVIDFQATSMENLQTLGFGRVQPIAVLAEIQNWKSWLNERLGEVSNDEFLKRMKEAKMSLEWVMSHINEVHVQINRADEQAQTAQEVIRVCTGEISASHSHADLLTEMHAHVQGLLANE